MSESAVRLTVEEMSNLTPMSEGLHTSERLGEGSDEGGELPFPASHPELARVAAATAALLHELQEEPLDADTQVGCLLFFSSFSRGFLFFSFLFSLSLLFSHFSSQALELLAAPALDARARAEQTQAAKLAREENEVLLRHTALGILNQ